VGVMTVLTSVLIMMRKMTLFRRITFTTRHRKSAIFTKPRLNTVPSGSIWFIQDRSGLRRLIPVWFDSFQSYFYPGLHICSLFLKLRWAINMRLEGGALPHLETTNQRQKRNVLEIFLFQIILKSYDMRHTIWLIIPDFLILDQRPI